MPPNGSTPVGNPGSATDMAFNFIPIPCVKAIEAKFEKFRLIELGPMCKTLIFMVIHRITA